MHPCASSIVAAAKSCVGTAFRPQGRTIGLGLDCVGVALIAARGAGVAATAPPYSLGGDRETMLDATLAAIGCTRTPAAPGDLLVVAITPHRRHLAVITEQGIVHAHAGLGRVVEGPLDPSWVAAGAWRLPVEG